MAGTGIAGEGSAASARQLAQQILAEGRFHKGTVPRPLHDVLREIGRVLESPLNALDELVEKLGSGIPGGSALVWAALAVGVLLASAALGARGTRRALRLSVPTDRSLGDRSAPSPAELEHRAAAAERDARYAEAVRYRFRAGLLRLAEREIVSDAPWALNRDVVRALRSPAFDELAARFDEITYGGRAAQPEDVQLSRDVWARVLAGGPSK